jgi:hypothetical protein
MPPKKTVLVPNRNYSASLDGHLPRAAVSVAAPPWEIEAELRAIGVVEKDPPARQERLARVAPLPTGPRFKPGQEIPF